ncbi:MAG TPA: PIN domain-containing protein [Chloroflexota bacterium]|nr:PIN domain-containing protein [Chloroflexota bacterium]
MRQAVVVDTGPLYAAIDRDDQYHVQAQAQIQRLNHQGLTIIILQSTLLEAYSLTLYRLGVKAAHRWLVEISSGALLVNPTTEDYQQAQQILLTFHDQSLSLFDAVLAAVSRRLETPIWSYDHHFDVLRVEVWRERDKA